MKKLTCRALCLLAALLLAGLMTAGAVFAEGAKEVVTIDYYGMQNNRSSMDGYMNDYLEKKIGVRVNVIPYDSEKTQTLLASGSLPDIGRYYVNNSVKPIIDTGLLMELTPYLDKLPNLTGNFPKAVDFARDVICGGKGLYCLPLEIGVYDSLPIDTGTYSCQLRWDIYEAIGAPEINSTDDLIKVMKQMMEYMPTLPDGTKTWGIAAFPEWDGSSMMSSANKIAAISGVQLNIGDSLMEYDIRADQLRKMIDKDSTYIKGVKFLFDCNQAGVLDPDSVTQTYNATQAKYTNGSLMCAMAGNYTSTYNIKHSNDDKPSAYLPLVGGWICPVVTGPQQVGGGNTAIVSVSSSTKKLDACLAFLNEMYDEETMLTMYNGPRGEMWDVKDGKLVPLEKMNELNRTGSTTLSSGEVLQDGQWWASWGWATDTPTSYGEPLRYSEWSTAAKQETDTKAFDMWRKRTGYEMPIDAYRKNGAPVYNSIANRFMPELNDDQQMVRNSVGEVVVQYSWKMVLAKDEAEFWALFDEMRSKCEGLGIASLEDACAAAWEKAKADAAPYEIKENAKT